MRIVVVIGVMLSFLCSASHGQVISPKTLPAIRTKGIIKVDGLLKETAWKDAAIMKDFIEFRPKIGAVEKFGTRTETYLMYNDEGIFFGGFCHESTRDSIATELKGRDGFGTNDYVGIIFDTYNDQLNGFEYFVTPVGEQWDAKMNPPSQESDMEDFSWNAVWQSGAIITDSGWSFEMFIPFSAIRFGKKEIQDWGLNVTRRRRKTEQQFTWRAIDPNINGFLTQEGTWKGISNIKPPLRLQFSPYFSVYANHYPAKTPSEKDFKTQVNGGLDVKYGINQAFTLDATLIPDFGQVQSDNQVLNLTPFEVKYNEYRNFFTEGTELFSKGNLFYSRRIGGSPIHLYDVYDQVDSNEIVTRNPAESKLINATKISGRMQNGLGIGFLNAITKTQYATIENTGTGAKRKAVTDPLTNYNVLVLDKTMKYNSSISFVNTNVWREGQDYDANVSAGLIELNDKTNNYNLGGKFAVSSRLNYLPNNLNETGLSHELHFGKTSGRFNYNISQERTDTKFSSDDLGYFTNNNFLNHSGFIGYKWVEPRGWYNNININLNGNISFLSKPVEPIEATFQFSQVNSNINIQSKKLWWVGMHSDYRFKENDFYEPRTTGYYFTRGASIGVGTWFESNQSKKYSFSTEVFTRTYLDFYDAFSLDLYLSHSFRFNNKLTVAQSIGYQPRFNNVGYTNVPGSSEIIFAKRQRNTIEHILTTKYSFNNKMGITFRARHYVSSVDNNEFYKLQSNGGLKHHPNYHPQVNNNVNYFNIDMVYTWQFAPGSFINVVWKTAAEHYSAEVEDRYFINLKNTITQDNNNNLSLKVIYFLDYLQLKNHHKK
jgi:hypothetical protein